MFTTLIVQPIFNVLVLIYALLPGHDFGLAIILFTIIVRGAMWPLLKRQLHQAKVMRELQPELKKIKKKAAGDRTKESAMLMELYKERGVNPVGSIGILIPQFIILIGLYNGLHRVVTKPAEIVSFAYPSLQHLGWMTQLAHGHHFKESLFGLVDLTRSASSHSGIYWPAMLIVLLSSIVQYYQSKMLLPQTKDARKLRDILRSSNTMDAADQVAETQAAVQRLTIFMLPVLIFFVTVNLPAALGLYWLTGGLVAIYQQWIILGKDETELEALADAPAKKRLADIPEAEVVTTPKKPKTTSRKKGKGRKK